MKKLLVVMVLLSVLAGLAMAESIGFIDVQKVFSQYKKTENAQAELGKKEEAFKKEFEDSQKKLEKAEKDGKGVEDLEKMRKELEEKLNPKREELLRLNQQLTTELQQEIMTAVEKVAKKVGIDLVLDKQVIITGGMDLTDMVTNELNK
ncbi:MAG: OmpH family outer membrane protein [bacterium]